jgi:hypothetical protein
MMGRAPCRRVALGESRGNKLTFNLGDSDRHAGVPDTTVTIVSHTPTQLQLQTVGETVVTLTA